MMRRTLLLIATLIAFPASAQVLPVLKTYPPAGPPGQPAPVVPGMQAPIEVLRADYAEAGVPERLMETEAR